MRRAASESWAGRWWSAAVSGDSSSRLSSRLCPVGQSGLCGALRARLCHRASVFPWPGLSWLVHAAVGRGRNATRRGETRDEWTERWRGRGTRHEARGTRRDRVCRE